MKLPSEIKWKYRSDSKKIIMVSSLKNFPDRLLIKNWENIGYGYFSNVFAKGDLVWKINTHISSDNAGYADGYIAYAQAIVLGYFKDNNLVPKIHLIILDKKGRFAVLMEKLTTTVFDRADDSSITKKIYNIISDMRSNYGPKYNPEHLYPIHCLIRKIVGYFDHSWSMDHHVKNFMYRKNGELVLIDPLSYMNGTLAHAAINDNLETNLIKSNKVEESMKTLILSEFDMEYLYNIVRMEHDYYTKQLYNPKFMHEWNDIGYRVDRLRPLREALMNCYKTPETKLPKSKIASAELLKTIAAQAKEIENSAYYDEGEY